MQISISTDFPALAKRLDALHSDIASKALARAVNRTLEQAKTSMSRTIRSQFNIPKAKVDQSLSIKRATFKGGTFRIEGQLRSTSKRGRSLNVISFGARQVHKPGGGVSVLIRKSAGRKLIKGAFIANQGRTVFRRVGDKRLPIEAVQTIDVPQMFNTKRINAVVVKLMRTKFPEIFEREVRFYTARWKG